MKVFLSWSGPRSQRVALALRDWLTKVLITVDPWMSKVDIDTGARWGSELALQLADTSFGVVCLTPENVHAPWVLFEAGALAKTTENTYLCPYLLAMSPSDVPRGHPLEQFQQRRADEEGTRGLLRTLNDAVRKAGERAILDTNFDSMFNQWWPSLKQELDQIASTPTETLIEGMWVDAVRPGRPDPNAQDAPPSTQLSVFTIVRSFDTFLVEGETFDVSQPEIRRTGGWHSVRAWFQGRDLDYRYEGENQLPGSLMAPNTGYCIYYFKTTNTADGSNDRALTEFEGRFFEWRDYTPYRVKGRKITDPEQRRMLSDPFANSDLLRTLHAELMRGL
jgi:hypothetical protein